MRIVLLGAPGSGKGTQAQRLSERLSVPAISTGDIFRANVADGTPLGKRAREYMDRGDYVPDEITNGMVADRLAEPDAAAGFLLDGYPRTLEQVNVLDSLLELHGDHLCAVLQLVVPEADLIERLRRRGAEQGRADDDDDVIRQRLAVYADQTAPLADVYAGRGLLSVIDGRADVSAVTDRLLDAVSDHRETCTAVGA
jgi:adenylate kinase